MTHPNDIDDGLRLFLTALHRAESAEARRDLFQNAVLESGGSYAVPRPGDNWGPHVVELQLLGISQTGEDEETAIANWTAAALRQHHAAEAARVAAARLSGDLRGKTATDLARDAECVRLYSVDPAAIEQAARIEAALAQGMIR